jgi:dephospho-CoA kinase
MRQRVRIVGLTGGIASGKTTVQRQLEGLGASVLDADAIYHELIVPRDGTPSELTRAIAVRFPGVVRPDGTLDRRVLGASVFSEARERAALDAITHPAVRRETAARMEALAAEGIERVIYDVPLLFEAGLETAMSGVLVVWVPHEVQLARVMARDGLDRESAEKRIRSQLSLDEKRRRATWVIDASGVLAETRAQVERWWQALRANDARVD